MNIQNDFSKQDIKRINRSLEGTENISLEYSVRPFSSSNFSSLKEEGKKINRIPFFEVYASLDWGGEEEYTVFDTVNMKMYDIAPGFKKNALDIARSLYKQFKKNSEIVKKDSAKNIRKKNLNKSNG